MASAAIFQTSEEIIAENADLIRAELERICKDSLFRDTTRMKRFLRYVTEETIAGRGARLKGYVIGLEVFDRPEDFDPQADTIVRVQAGQLRRRLDIYYAERGRDSAVRILVPKGRYAPTFEMRQTPKADKSADLKVLVRPSRPKSVNMRPSIAVMTLDDLSIAANQDEKRFAQGLTAEIVNALVQFRSMRIVTLTPNVSSSLAVKSVREIGVECGSDFVLTGSVRRDEDFFRIVVNLIQCETGEHLFSRVYDREYKPGNLFNLQEEIASYTASAVAAPFGVVNRFNRRDLKERNDTMEAHSCVMRYYDIKLSPTRNEAEALLLEVTRVTENNPEFSTGWSIQALLNTFLATQCIPIERPDERLIEADRTARRALSADGQSALGYFALYQSYFHRGQFANADRMIRRALSLNPNDYSMLAYYAICLALRGESDQALSMQSAALRLIGRAPSWYQLPQMVAEFKAENYAVVAGWRDRRILDTPPIFQLLALAAKAYSGEEEAVRSLVRDILAGNANYADDASASIGFWHIEPELSQQIYDGLLIAGLDIESLNPLIT